VRAQDARFQEAIVGYQDTVLRAQQEVENGLVSFVKSRERARLLGEAADAAKRSADLALVQYREGATDYTTVLTAQQNLLSVQDGLAEARGSIPRGLILAYRALGGGWELRLGRDLVPESTTEAMKKRTGWGGLLDPVTTLPEGNEVPDGAPRWPSW
jgi:outer membrane protein TolC